jgi:hypothetical protein
MRHTFTAVVALLILLLTGCASVADKRSAVASLPATVKSFADMEFVPVPLEQSRDLSLEDPKHVFAFPEGNGYFAAIALPASDKPRTIVFQSYSMGLMLADASVVVPKVTFLDDARRPLGTALPVNIRKKSDFLRGDSFEGRVAVPVAATKAVLQAAEAIGQSLIIRSENGTQYPVAPAPAGMTSVTVTTVAVATIEDSGFVEDDTTAQFFVVKSVDGKSVPNSLRETAAASRGTGFNQNAVFTGREIPAKPTKLTLRGTHRAGAPILEIASRADGTFFSVEGDVQFTPVAGGRYVVKGELRKEGSSVWLEDAATGKVVTEKVRSK